MTAMPSPEENLTREKYRDKSTGQFGERPPHPEAEIPALTLVPAPEDAFFDETPPEMEVYEDPYPGRDGKEKVWDPCYRCGGEGVIKHYQHAGNDGVCFTCNGSKGWMEPISRMRNRARGRVTRTNVERRRLHNSRMLHNANYRTAIEVNPAAVAWKDRIGDSEFLMSVWEQAFDKELSEKQLTAIGQSMDRDRQYAEEREKRKAEAVEVPEGRMEIEGTILFTDIKYTDFGSTLQMTVEDERGFRVKGTAPAALFDQDGGQPLKGRKVKFTGTVKRGREKGFGFYSRPAKAQLL